MKMKMECKEDKIAKLKRSKYLNDAQVSKLVAASSKSASIQVDKGILWYGETTRSAFNAWFTLPEHKITSVFSATREAYIRLTARLNGVFECEGRSHGQAESTVAPVDENPQTLTGSPVLVRIFYSNQKLRRFSF